MAITQTVKGKTSPTYLNNTGFDARDGKLKGYLLFPNSDCYLWTGVFTTDKKLAIDLVDISKPTDTWVKYQFDFKPPTVMVLTKFTVEGVKVSEFTYNKVK